MDNKVTFRTFKEGDYEMYCKWWKWWFRGITPPFEILLPKNNRCFIIESNNTPVAASFLYVDGFCGFLPWTASNPEYRDIDRRQLLELLIIKIQEEAKDVWGVKCILTNTDNEHLQNIYKKLGWYVDSTSNECAKYL